MSFDISDNKIVYLNLKYKDKGDNFSIERPFLIRKIKENKAFLIPITSQEKTKAFPIQYLISNPYYPTCLTSEKYPYSYANLSRRVII
ncbi:MAG: hypothetical protein LBR43_02245 [Spiroplasmataceae bacterium]|jgi:hypothetical protein|nr:hypothetical protein [Spiroplasmataceae bacterium]